MRNYTSSFDRLTYNYVLSIASLLYSLKESCSRLCKQNSRRGQSIRTRLSCRRSVFSFRKSAGSSTSSFSMESTLMDPKLITGVWRKGKEWSLNTKRDGSRDTILLKLNLSLLRTHIMNTKTLKTKQISYSWNHWF